MKNLFKLLLCISLITFTASAHGQKNKQTSTVVSSTTKTKTVTTANTQTFDVTEFDAAPQVSVIGNFMTLRFTKPTSGTVIGYTLYSKYSDCATAVNITLPYATIFNDCYYSVASVSGFNYATGVFSECSPYMPNEYVPLTYSPIGTVYTFRIAATFTTTDANGANVQYSKPFTYTVK